MPYYLTTISVSLTVKDENEAVKKIQKILESARETKDCKPYVDQIKKVTNNPDPTKRYEKLDQQIIKNLNITK